MRFVAIPILLAACLGAADDDKVVLPASAEDLARGKKLYDGGCLYCHGPRGDGGKGANLARQKLPRAATDGDLVRTIEVGIPGTEMPGAWHMTHREITQVAAYVRTFSQIDSKPVPGDPNAGRDIYNGKGGCAACHTLKVDTRTQGGLLGPDLTGIGARRGPDYLRESLVNPSAAVPDYFLETRVRLKSGREIVGYRLHEDTFSVLLRDYSGNNHALSKATVANIEKRRNQSPMPSYKDKLSAAELDDLVAYLVSLRDTK